MSDLCISNSLSASMRRRFGRSISLPIKPFHYRNKEGAKQPKSTESLQVEHEVLDDTTEDDSEGSLSPANDVMVSVQDDGVCHRAKSVTITEAEDVLLSHDEDSRPSCFCAMEEDLFTSILDEFFCQQSETGDCRQQSVSRSSSSYDDLEMTHTRIECILKEAYKEDKDESIDDEDDIIPPQITVSLSTDQMSLPRPSEWKQLPLLLTATPNSGMTIRGIRRLCDPSSFDKPLISQHTKQGRLMQLPINNGKEPPRQSWVVDFETDLFAGTALFRIRDCNTQALATTDTSVASRHDCFGGKNRKYQVCIRGRFKKKVVMASCVSGLLLDRPINTSRKTNSNAPPRWILRAAVRIANILSPRMDAELECEHPRVLSPLCSTAQTIKKEDPFYLDAQHEEPHPDSAESLVADLNNRGYSESRTSSPVSHADYAQFRKRTFNNIYDDYVQSKTNESPCFGDSEYTFEFLQHLVDYNDLSLDLGKAMGKIKLGAGLRGQPVRITAISNTAGEQGGNAEAVVSPNTSLWAFDLWHASNVCNE